MTQQLKWGILGAGSIAKSFATGLPSSKTGKLVAVGSRDLAKAKKFIEELDLPNASAITPHGSYEALLADPNVDALYIATPHPMHAEWTLKAAAAKKHLLVEKPIGLNAAETMAMIEAARVNNVFLMEAYMYRCHPQTHKLVELLRQKVIGDVRVIRATFSFHAGFHAEGRLYSNALGGGGILDVGGYVTSMTRLIAGVALGQPFADPIEVKGSAHLGQTGVDEWAVAALKFPGNILGELSCGVAVNQENVVRIFGSEGTIVIHDPWVPAREGGKSTITIRRNNEEPRDVIVESTQQIYAIEADTVAAFLTQRQAASPAMSWDDTLGNMKTLDAWRDSIRLVYAAEQPGVIPTVTRAPLRVAAPNRMKYATISGIDKQLSRLVMGCDNQPNLPYAAVMFDDFFARGGNVFDTAYIYQGGLQEKLLGQWITTRGVREQVAIIVKGAHTPYCTPLDIARQLGESLHRLGTTYGDLYIMHRDNPQVPVGEFVDVLNEQLNAGRIKRFGGSNWTIARFNEANAYAAKHGKQGFAVLSNNFSLARMVSPIWGGCVSASDPDSRAWLEQTQTPIFAWSSQARGFFLPGRAAPNKTDDEELTRCWYSPDNFQRLERVNQLAKKKDVRPINIALAYVLHQPFPAFALIGPRTLEETRTSFAALDVVLSPQEVKWLNLEAEDRG
jgi:predicted dehydrogenase/aryl-alcohol dehydrogenase-like predicted oxidoreductase